MSDMDGGVVLLDLVCDVVRAGPSASGIAEADASLSLLLFRKDCTDLVRRIALLKHLGEEIRDFGSSHFSKLDASASSSSSSWSADLVVALRAAHRLLSRAGNFRSSSSSVSFIFLLVFVFFYFSVPFSFLKISILVWSMWNLAF